MNVHFCFKCFTLFLGKIKIKEDFKVLTKKQTELSRIVGQGNDSHHSKSL